MKLSFYIKFKIEVNLSMYCVRFNDMYPFVDKFENKIFRKLIWTPQ